MKTTDKRSDLRRSIGRNAKRLRQARGLTQFDVALRMNLAKTGVTVYPGRVSQIENGVKMPSTEMLCALALALDTTLDTLTGFVSIFEGWAPE